MPSCSDLKHLEHNATIDYRYEIVRKGIHLFSLCIPVIYYYISRQLALCLLLPVTAAFFGVDMARYYVPAVSNWFYRWFGWLLRRHETDIKQKRLNGASNVLISASLCVLMFPKVIAINAFTILIISDTAAALFGRRFGRHRFLSKSLEGSLAFFVTAVIVILIAPKVSGITEEYIIGIVAAAIGTIVEVLPVKIDDNISIPLAIGFSIWCLYVLFLPSLILVY